MIDKLVQFSNFIFGLLAKLYLAQILLILLSVGIFFLAIFITGKFRYTEIVNVRVLNKAIDRKKINPEGLLKKNIIYGLVPLFGLISILNMYYLYINFIIPFEKVRANKKEILQYGTLSDLLSGLERFGIDGRYAVELAKSLIDNNDHKETVISSTEYLNSILIGTTKTDDYTKNAIKVAYEKYVSILELLKNKPKKEETKIIENTIETFDNISEQIKNNQGGFL